MKKITYNERLNTELGALGFKRKNMHIFLKNNGQAVQELRFDSKSGVVKHSIEYTIYVRVFFPFISDISNQIEMHLSSTVGQQNIGTLYPKKRQASWIVSPNEKGDEIVINTDFYSKYSITPPFVGSLDDVIDDMVSSIKKYAIPFLDKYSVMSNVISRYEGGDKQIADEELVSLLYLKEHGKSASLEFLGKTLKHLRETEPKEETMTVSREKTENAEIIHIEVRGGRLKQFEEFAIKFRKYLEEHE